MFTIYSDSGSDSTMVSNLFIDEYMKSANDAQIKIYLYLLRVMGAHRATSVSDMADQFNHTEKDVVRSLRYWEKKGLLDLTFRRDPVAAGTAAEEDELVSICLRKPTRTDAEAESAPGAGAAGRILSFPETSETILDSTKKAAGQLPMVSGGSLACPERAETRLSGKEDPDRKLRDPEKPGQEGPEAFRQDAGMTQLLFVAEQYIGKPLSPKEVQTICYLSGELRFSDDMIDYLLQYCLDRGKRDFRYIKKVAENWAEEGITTPRQAEIAAAASASAPNTAPAQSGAAKAPAPGARPQTKKKGRSSRARTANSFNQFEQNDYDFDALEEELLNTSGLS